MNRLIGLLVCLSVAFPFLKAQDIDFPISLSEIEKYENRVPMQRLPDVAITHPDAYKIRTQQPAYSPQTSKIIVDVINVNAVTAEPEHHRLEKWENGKWVAFPFIDNLVFTGVGRDLSKGDTLPEYIHASTFKYPLKPGKYKVHFYVFTNLATYCELTDHHIRPVKESEMEGAFGFRVVDSANDSLRIVFENHTNLSVQPIFLPSVETDTQYVAHPLARSGWSGEADYMRSRALLQAGEAMLFSIPVTWDIRRISNPHEKERFKSGKLSPGRYKIGLQVDIYMDTEFEVH